MEDQAPIRIFCLGCGFFVYRTADILRLRAQYRLVGALCGALPSKKRKSASCGSPLLLSYEETLLAVESRFAILVKYVPSWLNIDAKEHDSESHGAPSQAANTFCNIPTEDAAANSTLAEPLPEHELRKRAGGREMHAKVFRALWMSGMYVTGAAKYGADYLVYPGDPLCCHASMLVHVMHEHAQLRLPQRICMHRLATAIKKLAIIARVTATPDVKTGDDAKPLPAERSMHSLDLRYCADNDSVRRTCTGVSFYSVELGGTEVEIDI